MCTFSSYCISVCGRNMNWIKAYESSNTKQLQEKKKSWNIQYQLFLLKCWWKQILKMFWWWYVAWLSVTCSMLLEWRMLDSFSVAWNLFFFFRWWWSYFHRWLLHTTVWIKCELWTTQDNQFEHKFVLQPKPCDCEYHRPSQPVGLAGRNTRSLFTKEGKGRGHEQNPLVWFV